MKKFRFTLQPVATVRDLQEMRAREGFALAVREVGARSQALSQQQLRVAEFVEALIAGRETGFAAAMQASFLRAYREEVAAERKALDALTQAEQERELARRRWIDTHVQLRLVEKLRDRARERHAADGARFEQRQLDDRAPRGDLFPTT